MISKILPYLDKYLPVGLAVKGLASTPQIASFMGSATAAGYGIDAVLDQLRDIYEPPAREEERKRVSRKESQGVLRPDEIPSKSPQLLKKAASLGGGALAAGLLGKSKENIPEILPPESKEAAPKQIEYERKQIGFSPRTKEPEHRFPKSKPSSPIPPDLEEKIKFHMGKSGLSVEDAVEVVGALYPSQRKSLKDLKKKGAFQDLRMEENVPTDTKESSNNNELVQLLSELINRL